MDYYLLCVSSILLLVSIFIILYAIKLQRDIKRGKNELLNEIGSSKLSYPIMLYYPKDFIFHNINKSIKHGYLIWTRNNIILRVKEIRPSLYTLKKQQERDITIKLDRRKMKCQKRKTGIYYDFKKFLALEQNESMYFIRINDDGIGWSGNNSTKKLFNEINDWINFR